MEVLPGIPDDFVKMLSAQSGLKPLPIVSACDLPKAAAGIFCRDGVVAVQGALQSEQLQRLRRACSRVMQDIVRHDPEGLGGRGPKRYSFGGSSSTRAQLHHAEWAELVDVPAVTQVLDAIWGSSDYACVSAGGDFCLAGAPGHQNLHSDMVGRYADEKPPMIAVNFLVEDQTPFNGPLRQIPQTQCRHMRFAPELAEEPKEWILSTMCPLPAGTAIIRDLRAWHGGTPNISASDRAMPNAEFVAPFCLDQACFATASMPFHIWEALPERGRHLARFLRADPGETVAPQVRFDMGLGDNDFFGGWPRYSNPVLPLCMYLSLQSKTRGSS